MNDATVPEQRADDALPEWIDLSHWTTSQACVFVAAVRDITPESARRWLGRHVVPVDREPGREGENRYAARVVRFRAQPDGTLGDDPAPLANLYHD